MHVAGLAALASCLLVVRTDDLVPATADVGTESGSCVLEDGADPCLTVPRLSSAQNIDAIDDEFCGIPAAVLIASKGAVTVPSPPPELPEVVHARFAWSDVGLHV